MRIETIALGERPAQVDTGCPLEMDKRATSAPKDASPRARAPGSSHHEICSFWLLASLLFSSSDELQDI